MKVGVISRNPTYTLQASPIVDRRLHSHRIAQGHTQEDAERDKL